MTSLKGSVKGSTKAPVKKVTSKSVKKRSNPFSKMKQKWNQFVDKMKAGKKKPKDGKKAKTKQVNVKRALNNWTKTHKLPPQAAPDAATQLQKDIEKYEHERKHRQELLDAQKKAAAENTEAEGQLREFDSVFVMPKAEPAGESLAGLVGGGEGTTSSMEPTPEGGTPTAEPSSMAVTSVGAGGATEATESAAPPGDLGLSSQGGSPAPAPPLPPPQAAAASDNFAATGYSLPSEPKVASGGSSSTSSASEIDPSCFAELLKNMVAEGKCPHKNAPSVSSDAANATGASLLQWSKADQDKYEKIVQENTMQALFLTQPTADEREGWNQGKARLNKGRYPEVSVPDTSPAKSAVFCTVCFPRHRVTYPFHKKAS